MRTNITLMAAPILLSLNQRPLSEATGASPTCKQDHINPAGKTQQGPMKPPKNKHKKKTKIKMESIARISVSPIVVPNRALRIHR